MFSSSNLIESIARIIVIIIMLTLHEFAHGYAALLCGDRTAKNQGRLTLNPVSHFDPMGFLMILFMPFGYAKPVPVNPYNFNNRRRGMFFVSVAGITVNLIFAFIFTGIYVALLNYTNLFYLSNDALSLFLYALSYYFIVTNLALFCFNILPIFPLDGFHIVESFTRYNNKYNTFMRKNGAYILMGLLLESVLVSRLPAQFQFLDIFGNFMSFITGYVLRPFLWFWNLILGVR